MILINEEMFGVMRYIAAVGANIEASIFLDHTLVGAYEYSNLSWTMVEHYLLVKLLIG